MMLSSANLCAIPFLGHCDNSRLQMSAKQLNQVITNLRCQVPKVIGRDYRYLSDCTQLFKFTAPLPGEIEFINDDIMIAIFNSPNGESFIEVFEIPIVKQCSSLYATTLRYRRESGPFNVGDLLYEYDCFHDSIPTYGYNLLTAYMPFFGLNHEDALVISEEAADLCRCTKTEQILVPIYTYSLFKSIYDGDDSYKIVPRIGEKVKDNVVAFKSQLKTGRNSIQHLKALNITDFTDAVNDEFQFNNIPIHTRIPNGTVVDVKLHRMPGDQKVLVDKNLQNIINRMRIDHGIRVKEFNNQLMNKFNEKFRKELLGQHYVMIKHLEVDGFDKKELAYIIELKISGEYKTQLGDKFANRYANKGVVSLILPNELRPYAVESKQPVDSIVGPISVVSRMNFGQVLEGLISKAVNKAEKDIRSGNNPVGTISKIENLAKIMHDDEYAQNINDLKYQVKTNEEFRNKFLQNVRDVGLFYEAPNFGNFDIAKLKENINSSFGVNETEPVIIPRKTIQYMKDRFKLDVAIPNEDVVMPNIFVAPIYTIKLKQLAKSKSTSRDFGNYKATNRQPSQGRNRDGVIAQGSRLGQMEFLNKLLYTVMCIE